MTKTVKEILNEVRGYGMDYLSKFDPKTPAGYLTDRDIPTVIILKRKAIRVFPDNQKIALYYSQALDKYISIPYGKNNKALGMHLSEAAKKKDEDNLSPYYAAKALEYKKNKVSNQKMVDLASKLSGWQVAKDKELSKHTISAIRQSGAPAAAKIGAYLGMGLTKAAAILSGARARQERKKQEFEKQQTTPTSAPETKPTGGSGQKVFAGGKFIGYEKDLTSTVLKNRGTSSTSKSEPVKKIEPTVKSTPTKPKEDFKPIQKRSPKATQNRMKKIQAKQPGTKFAPAAVAWASQVKKSVGPK